MYHSVEEFLKDWTFEAEGTVKALAALTDASLNQKVTPEGRDLGQLAWHLTSSISEMMRRTGLPVEGPEEDAPRPASAAEILATYKTSSDSMVSQLKEQWTDATLEDEVDMYGETWKKGFVLSVLELHQTHHRGQMTVLMRQAGLTVPGIYGPAREEWAAFGMTAPN